MTTGALSYFEGDGKSVYVDLLYSVTKDQVMVADGWLGIAATDGDSGDTIAEVVDMREYQFTVPSTLSVSKGQIVYIDITDTTGHTPDDTAYGTSAGSNCVAFFKATADKDVNNVVTGIMLGQLLS
jgi:hypothetical protein